MAENENIKEFKEAVEETAEKVEEPTKEIIQIQKKGFLAAWSELKMWQKVLILTGAGTLVFVGGRWIFKAIKKKPEVVAEVAEAADNVIPIEDVVQDIAQ